jgi:hypothetical protein
MNAERTLGNNVLIPNVSGPKLLHVLAALLALSSIRARAETYTVSAFDKIQLTDQFWSEGAAFGDLNRDGYNDIVSGPYWYEGPDFKKRHEFRQASGVEFLKFVVDPKDGRPPDQLLYSDSFVTFVCDFNGDGWPDILSINVPGKEASWYENPGKKGLVTGAPWKRHVAFDVVNNESPTFGDLLGTGKPVLAFMTGGYLGYAIPDWKNPGGKWAFHAVSAKGAIPDDPFIHGLGFGDVNGDGRNDLLGPIGWWEQPTSLEGDPMWKFHKWSFLQARPDPVASRALPDKPTEEELEKMEQYSKWPYTLGGAQIYAYDVNGDGLPDIISSLDAHGYGLAWFEQLKDRDATGETKFKCHIIMNKEPSENSYGVEFSQLHAVALIDMDGDGLKDIVTGKRFWAHGRYEDEEPGAPAVLYWFGLVRSSGGKAEFVPHLVDADSGVGTQVVAGDVNGDGRPDIVVANKKGTFVLLQKKVSKEEWQRNGSKVQFKAPHAVH